MPWWMYGFTVTRQDWCEMTPEEREGYKKTAIWGTVFALIAGFFMIRWMYSTLI